MSLPSQKRDSSGEIRHSFWQEIPTATKLYFSIIVGLIFLLTILVLIRTDFFSFEWMQIELPKIGDYLPSFGSDIEEFPTPFPGSSKLIVQAQKNVYNGPGLDYDVIETLDEGTEVGLIGRSVDSLWWAIMMNESEYTAWVNNADVRIENIAELAVLDADGNEISQIDAGSPIAITRNTTDIYSGPGDNFDQIGYLEAGQSTRLNGRTSDGLWWAIEIPYVESGLGWVSSEQIFIENPDRVNVISVATESSAMETNTSTRRIVTAIANVNIRSGPGLSYPKIGVLPNGQQADAISISPDGFWFEVITLDGVNTRGWISKDYVVPQDFNDLPESGLNIESGELFVPTPAQGSPSVSAVTMVNIRSGPGLEYAVLGRMEPGQSAEILAVSPDKSWWKIKLLYRDQEWGWVAVDFVQANNATGISISE